MPLGSLSHLAFYSVFFIIKVIFLLYVILYFLQDYLLFHPQPLRPSSQQLIAQNYPQSELKVTTTDGIQLQGWLLSHSTAQPEPLVIYFGGNAEEVSSMIFDLERFIGWSLLLVNYRGYGLSQGRPSEKKLFNDALTIFDQVTRRQEIDAHRVVAMGRSLGTGVAVHLAAHRPLMGVILVSPYDSITEVGQRHFPWVPVSWLLKHPFNSIALVPSIKTPLLALVGQQDTLIPPSHSYRLLAQWGGPHEIQVIKNADHNNISFHATYWPAIQKFLISLKMVVPISH